ncbi:MAG: restriction endonuclease subunit S [Candidatus Accumulibacter sp.]|uniref:Restriction endonuclease subunit S n=1 Tax=Candidatus Accumulibacter cognatus TaxID=2954383 RepID=A0A7D5SU31_9PROT|nr:restriction endonuclease subunit S [Accumulibacter sp.]MBN8518695.1 restriction endonuclease subunit S [Accumulibacter sp.]MBO3710329.1 restriction endonuclease subunit S [Accumulibacter sp.]QLH51801.1 MAG: restriction endonuclease subunit S [Candidatus Accumulibacter cognatus]
MAEKQLKPGWQIWRFDQMATNVNVRVDNPSESGMEHYVGLEHLDPDSLKIRRWGTPNDVEATKLMFKKGDIIFGRRRAYQRKLGVAEFDGICSAHAMVLRAKPDIVLPEFLPFFMQSDLFMNRAVEISVGSLSPTINWKTMAVQQFALPPKVEQQRILEGLKSSYDLVESFQDLIFACEQLWKSRTTDLFATGTRVEKVQLGDLVDYSSDGPFGSKLKTEHYSDQGARVIRLNNIDPLEFNNADSAFVPLEYFRELHGYEVKGGDVIIAGLGDDRIPMGRACIVPLEIGAAINKADCYCLRTSEKLSARYLIHFLNSNEGLKQARSMAQGTTRKRLNLSNIRRFGIPFRSLAEQDEIAEELDSYLSAKKKAVARLESSLVVRDQMRESAFAGVAHV